MREVLHRWKKLGVEGLWKKPGRGGKPRCAEADMMFLEECLENEPRTYNSVQVTQKLEQERWIKLIPGWLRQVLKKGGYLEAN